MFKVKRSLYTRVLFEKLAVVQMLKNIHGSHGTRRFVTGLARDLHWTVSLKIIEN
jgi:hypothetical protein